MPVLSQKHQVGQFHCALGDDVLLLVRFNGTDFINENAEFHVEVLCDHNEIDVNSLLGTYGTLTVKDRTDAKRYFGGIITSVTWSGYLDGGYAYTLTLRSWFWLAGLRRNNRIFHQMSVVDVIQTVLTSYAGLGHPHLKVSLSKSYKVNEYTVQYRESDLTFTRRLMERFGISFYFTFADGSHTMHLVDGTDNLPKYPAGTGKIPYWPSQNNQITDRESLVDVKADSRMTTGAIRVVDYDFEDASRPLEAFHTRETTYSHSTLESFDYPAGFMSAEASSEVAGNATLRLDQETAGAVTLVAAGDTLSLRAGMTFELGGDNKQLGRQGVGDKLCLQASHSFGSQSYGTGTSGGGSAGYRGQVLLWDKKIPLVPQRRTPEPVVQGPQTGVVVGSGEIDCDAYGRILVKFHWDLDNAYSMRCRVSQNWASKNWGGMIIPRVGMEVVVEFLEGNPERPLVTGCVYNSANMPPYTLPAEKSKSVFKTKSFEGSGFNELTFEDKSGSEQIYMHGEKDQLIEIKNDRRKDIGNDDLNKIGNNWTYKVGGNASFGVSGTHTTAVRGNMEVGVESALTTQVMGNHVTKVNGKQTISAMGGIESVTMNQTITGLGSITLATPAAKITIGPGSLALSAPLIQLTGLVQMGGMGAGSGAALQAAAVNADALVPEPF